MAALTAVIGLWNMGLASRHECNLWVVGVLAVLATVWAYMLARTEAENRQLLAEARDDVVDLAAPQKEGPTP